MAYEVDPEHDAKVCARCGETKFLIEFYWQKTSLDGFGSYCKTCNLANAKAWRKEHPERVPGRRLRALQGGQDAGGRP